MASVPMMGGLVSPFKPCTRAKTLSSSSAGLFLPVRNLAALLAAFVMAAFSVGVSFPGIRIQLHDVIYTPDSNSESLISEVKVLYHPPVPPPVPQLHQSLLS